MTKEIEDAVEVRTAFKATGITKDSKIKILAESNPKRPSSTAYERFEGYLTTPPPSSVEEALKNGLTMGDIKFDFIHNFIDIEGATVEEYVVKPRGPRSGDSDSKELEVEVQGEDENF